MNSRSELRSQAMEALARGNPLAAAQGCARILLLDPNDIEGLVLSGKSRAALGQLREAAGDLRRALALQPELKAAYAPYGVVLALMGDYKQAQRILEQALSFDRSRAEPHFGLGLCRLGAGDWSAAERWFREALLRDPELADARNNIGVALDRQGRLAQAAQEFRSAIASRPRYLTAHLNLADAMMRLGQPAAAIGSLQSAAELCPQDAGILADLGAAQLATGALTAAQQTLERALAMDPKIAAAAANLGEVLRRLGEADRAAAAFAQALSIRQDLPEAHLGLAKIEAERGEARAVARLLEVVRLRPSSAEMAVDVSDTLDSIGEQQHALAVLQLFTQSQKEAGRVHAAMGRLLQRLGRFDAARESYERALRIEPERGDWALSLASVLESMGRYSEAIQCIERVEELSPGQEEHAAALLSCAIRVCDWTRTEHAIEQLHRLPLGADFLPPFLLLATDWSPAEQAESMRRHSRELCKSPRALSRVPHGRLRIAYVSPDFREHPVAHALAGIIAKHDRGTFSPIAVSLTAPDASEIGSRLRASFDEVIDASSMSNAQLERALREREIDIAIDLAGHTAGARPGLFGRRVAPMQINFLGFSTSTGLSTMDHIIADAIVLPPGDEPLYTENVLRMPHSYLPFDDSRETPRNAMGRADAGLPTQGFVFCGFNNAYKITRAQFDLWLELLRATPGSVLWLRQMSELTTTNLRAAQRAAGVDDERLIFAPHMPRMADHLARLTCADLFLDTSPYNAHTTAAEALWAGVPVLTCRGANFAGRVGASLLQTLGLTECIAEDRLAYREKALGFAHNSAALLELRQKLSAARSASPLFDTRRYTRDFEQLLLGAWR